MHQDTHCLATYGPNPSREVKVYRRYKENLKDLHEPAVEV